MRGSGLMTEPTASEYSSMSIVRPSTRDTGWMTCSMERASKPGANLENHAPHMLASSLKARNKEMDRLSGKMAPTMRAIS